MCVQESKIEVASRGIVRVNHIQIEQDGVGQSWRCHGPWIKVIIHPSQIYFVHLW